MAGSGPMMTYKDYEKVIEQPKGITQHSAIAAQSSRLTFRRVMNDSKLTLLPLCKL